MLCHEELKMQYSGLIKNAAVFR